jgi:hypothetical protein
MMWQTAPGAAVKAVESGDVEGLLVVFGSPDTVDLENEYFTKETDFGRQRETPIWLNHAQPVKTTSGLILIEEPIGYGTLEVTDEGVIIRGLLDAKYRYLAQIARELGWSSGTASHLVMRETVGKATYIKRWLLGLDASITPTPAEPRTMLRNNTLRLVIK